MDQTPSGSSTVQVQQVQQPAKFSRYRSVRKAAAASAHHATSTVPPPLPTNPSSSNSAVASSQNESIQRSMSRYRHAKPTKIVTSIPPPPLPTLPASHQQQYADIESWVDATRKSQETTRFQAYSPEQDRDFAAGSFYDAPKQSPSQPASPRFGNFSRILGRSSMDWHRKKEEYSPPRSAGDAQPSPLKQAYSGERQHEVDGKYARAQPENAHASTSPLQHEHDQGEESSPMDVVRSTRDELLANERATAMHNGFNSGKKLVKGRGGLLSRIKGNDHSGSSKPHREAKGDLKTMISSPTLIDPKDLPSGLPDDTPISAVNAGERSVLVTCNDSFINLPITPTTKVQDVLHSAATCLTEDINPKTAVLMESFKPLGIERPLRRYEHVRDVMNSWDDDTQNYLEVVTAPEVGISDGLDVRSAPRKQPRDSTFHIYHCQRPGKWDKRYITLRADGQVLMAKKQGAETMNICHISDFDIYCPKKREYRRIKPPKKLCFVIKSQQKSNMFLTSDNFAHFFSLSDPDTGSQWYNVVQQWRSWYLVSVMGEGSKGDKPESHSPVKGASHNGANRFSTGSIQYPPGFFKPLVDMNVTTKEIVSRPTTPREEVLPAPKQPSANPKRTPLNSHSNTPLASAPTSPRSSYAPPDRAGVKKRERSQTTAGSKPPTSAEPFMSTGLLGRTYTVRQNAMREREREKELAEQNNPFTTHGLLNNIDTQTHSLDRSGHTSSGPPSRENTIRSPSSSHHHHHAKPIQKPLVDLTPTYQEPPQHARKGRGVAAQPGMLLVDIATGPERCPGAIIVPSATTWRKPTGQRSGTMSSQIRVPEHFAAAPRARQRSHTMRSTHHSGAAASTTSPPETPFIPTGLLAQSKVSHAQGSAQTGHGVATGNRNASGRPLLDVSEPSRFAEGSLLRSVEQSGTGEDGHGHGPVIDREK
ncbi:hypothetical protein PRK78_001658 [Emydomyces testavorans]|uniref:PH domain-containing protein n=1 Tax=Emydomyces testavorans TaxID=2070801 RepID=A0AAF0IIW3_9EURO|nr:hypothetical protein PRK78_001658 [Emydomyces testavorans]